MMRVVNLISILVAVILIACLYHIRYDVDNHKREMLRVESNILANKKKMKVLRAEWSALNNPIRLEKLSKQYLALEAIRPAQLISLKENNIKPLPTSLAIIEAGQ